MGLKQLDQTEVAVGSYKFYISPFPAFKAANLTGELASVLAPVLGVLTPLINSDGNTDALDINAGDFAQALSCCTAIDGEKLEHLLRKLLLGGNVVVDYYDEEGGHDPKRLDEDTADEIFCGDIQNMFILAYHVISRNFSGFFRNIAVQSGPAKESAKKVRQIV